MGAWGGGGGEGGGGGGVGVGGRVQWPPQGHIEVLTVGIAA